MKIRKATLKDLKRIDEIYLEGSIDELKLQFPEKTRKSLGAEFNKYIRKIREKTRKRLKSKKEFWLVAEVNGLVIGFATAGVDQFDKTSCMFLENYIDKKYRRRGIGRKLSKERLKWAKKKKFKYAAVEVFYKNKASIKNLEGVGFKLTRSRLRHELK